MSENEQDQGSDLRSDLEAAMEQATSAVPEPAPVEQEAPLESAPAAEVAAPVETDAEARARDEKGRFAKKTDGPKVEEPPAPEQPKPVEEAKPPVVAEAPKADVKAPQSLKPVAREQWSRLPAEFEPLKQEFARRERETTMALQESAEARQYMQRHKELVAPYEPIMRSMGVDSGQATRVAFQTMAQLISGPPMIKAQTVAEIIRTYGVDIAALDGILSGQPPQTQQPQYGQPAQTMQPQQFRDPRLDQLLAMQEQRLEQKAAQQLEEVKGEEFFDDVREVMADILDTAAKRGVSISLKDAYNRACWANPDVAEVLSQRQAARQAANPTGSTQRAKLAASSVKASPVVPAVGNNGDDLRSTLEAAFNRASR